METNEPQLKGLKRILYKKYQDEKPEASVEAVSYDNEKKNLTVKVTPSNPKYLKMVEVTVRDFKGRDRVRKLKKAENNFMLKSRIFLDRQYNFSFYLLGKDGKYSRTEKTMESVREDLKRIEEFNIKEVEQKEENAEKTRQIPKVKRNWPNSSAYAQSLQNVEFSISKKYEDLRKARFIPNSNVKYRSLIQGAGNFGVVFKFQINESFYAMKCFTRASQYIDTRYYEISKGIENSKLPFLIDFRYYSDAVRTTARPAEYFPVITMGWIEGKTLFNYIQENFSDSAKMNAVARQFLQTVIDMQAHSIAHGDLSGDNILITSGGQLKIIDYDGMFVPALKDLGSEELGHESFQHPKRGKYYGPKLDNFSALIIYLSLFAISKSPDLWKYNQNDPDKLLFDINDFNNPGESAVMRDINKIGGKAKRLVDILLQFLKNDPDWDGIDLQKIMKMR